MIITYLCIIYVSLTLFHFIHYNNINAFLITKSLFLKYSNLPINKGLHHTNFMMIEDKNRIKPTGIEIYSTTGCKYCRIAKAKLIELGLDFKNYDIHNNNDHNLDHNSAVLHDSYINTRIEYARKRTVPQIYVYEEHIGGCNELLQDIKDGLFQQRLNRYNISTTNVKSVPHVNMNETFLPLNKTYLVIDNQPLNSVDYRSMIVNNISTGMISRRQYTAVELSGLLQQTALKLLDTFVGLDGKKINYKTMSHSKEFEEYLYLSTLLADCSILELQHFSDVDKLIFYSNLYNAMIVHANCVLSSTKSLESTALFTDLRSPEAIAQRTAFFSGNTGAIYQIGPYFFSPDDIEHGILRCNIPHPSQIATANLKKQPKPLTYFSIDDPRAVLSISRNSFDPRIHFLLNCGALSCPPIKVLDSNNYQTAISLATSTYLLDEIKIQSLTLQPHTNNNSNNVIYLPRLLLWYASDFGTNIIHILQTILAYLPHHSPIYQELHTILYNSTEEFIFILSEHNTVVVGEYNALKLLPLTIQNNNINNMESLTTRIIELVHTTTINTSNKSDTTTRNSDNIDDRYTYRIEYNLYDWTFNST